VNGYEVRQEDAKSKFKVARKFSIAAMLLLMPHQTAPLCCTLEAPLPRFAEAVCLLESSNAREKVRG
jgi:hypothetical protein